MTRGRASTAAATALAAALLPAAPAGAAEPRATANYPSRPIRGIVPYQPGGPTDIMARMVGARLAEGLGQQVIIDNRGGGSGVIAAVLAKDAPPDGHTIFFATITALTTMPALSSKLPYDPLRDYAAITQTSSNPYIIAAHPSVAPTFGEFLALAKAKPGRISYGSAGTGGGAHLAAELLRMVAKIDMVHVPYKGTGPSIPDLLAGQIQIILTGPTAVSGHVHAGRLRGLAMTSRRRLASWPDLPTVAEHGFPDYEAGSWQALVAPAGTPPAIIDRLYRETLKALAWPDLAKRLAAEGAEIVGSPPAEFTRYIRDETAKWRRVVREANIRVE